ncbi:MAG: hypothetical protein ACI9MC_003092 [Kiritimatiellia bacterium]
MIGTRRELGVEPHGHLEGALRLAQGLRPRATQRPSTAHSGPTKFDDFVKAAWQRHAEHTHDVYDRLSDGSGEHDKRDEALVQGASDHPAESDEVPILSTAASALLGQDRVEDAISAFNEPPANADYARSSVDPASRALATAGDNMAATLEARPNLDGPARDLLRIAAYAGRKFWEAGSSWMNAERVEYRLAMTHLPLSNAIIAGEHAQNWLDICTENSTDALEHFFAHVALAKARHTAGSPTPATAPRDLAAEQVVSFRPLGQPYTSSVALLDLERSDGPRELVAKVRREDRSAPVL